MSIPGRPQLSLQPPAGRGRGAVRIATWAAGEGRRPGGGGVWARIGDAPGLSLPTHIQSLILGLKLPKK